MAMVAGAAGGRVVTQRILMPRRTHGMVVIMMFPLDTRPMPYVGMDTCPSG
jgi:hypothetical protein